MCRLKGYYDFCDLEYANVIKYISTLWLSLELCLNQEVEKYCGVKSFFQSKNFADRRFERLQSSFNNPVAKVYV